MAVKCFVKKLYQIRKRIGYWTSEWLGKFIEFNFLSFFFQIGTRWLSPIIAHYIIQYEQVEDWKTTCSSLAIPVGNLYSCLIQR